MAVKVLLIQPPIQDFYQTSIRIQPLGLAYLASVLEQAGFEVSILDAQSTAQKRTIPLPAKFQYIREYYTLGNLSPFKLFSQFYHFGISFEEIEERVKAFRPDAVGITSLFTAYHDTAALAAAAVKKADARIPVIFGGTHPTQRPEEVLQDPNIDFVVLGEAEFAFRDLLLKLFSPTGNALEKIAGIGFKNGKTHIFHQQNIIPLLDDLPYPARHLLDPDSYLDSGKRMTMLLTSRGCPYKCQFCSIPFTEGAKYRKRTAEKVVEEVIHCYEHYGTRSFDIEDDNFTVDMKRSEKILDLLAERFPGGEIELSAMNGISTTTLNDRLLGKMRRSGFRRLNIALVSDSEEYRKEIERPETNFHFDAVVRAAHAEKLETVAYLIFGMPGQNPDEMMNSMIHLMEQPVLIGPSFFYPVPGSVLYDECVKKGWVIDGDFSRFRSSLMSVETDVSQREHLVTFFHLVRTLNFMKQLLDDFPPLEEEPDFSVYLDRLSKELPPSREGEGTLLFEKRLTETEAGLLLLRRFLGTQRIHHLKLLRQDGTTFQYEIGEEKNSPELIRQFFLQASGHSVASRKEGRRLGLKGVEIPVPLRTGTAKNRQQVSHCSF